MYRFFNRVLDIHRFQLSGIYIFTNLNQSALIILFISIHTPEARSYSRPEQHSNNCSFHINHSSSLPFPHSTHKQASLANTRFSRKSTSQAKPSAIIHHPRCPRLPSTAAEQRSALLVVTTLARMASAAASRQAWHLDAVSQDLYHPQNDRPQEY